MFRKINKWCTKQYIMLPIAGMFTFVSCQKETIGPTSTNQGSSAESSIQTLAKNQEKYTGEEIFEAVFFSKGEFVKLIPQFDASLVYEGMTPAQLAQVDALILDLENKLRQRDHKFFKDFKKDLEKATVAEYEGIIEKAGIEVSMALLQDQSIRDNFISINHLDPAVLTTILNNNDTEALKAILYSDNGGIALAGQNKTCLAVAAVVVLVVWEAAAAVNVAAVATVAVAVYAKFWFWPKGGTSGTAGRTNKSDPTGFEAAMAELYGAINSTK